MRRLAAAASLLALVVCSGRVAAWAAPASAHACCPARQDEPRRAPAFSACCPEALGPTAPRLASPAALPASPAFTVQTSRPFLGTALAQAPPAAAVFWPSSPPRAPPLG